MLQACISKPHKWLLLLVRLCFYDLAQYLQPPEQGGDPKTLHILVIAHFTQALMHGSGPHLLQHHFLLESCFSVSQSSLLYDP